MLGSVCDQQPRAYLQNAALPLIHTSLTAWAAQ